MAEGASWDGAGAGKILNVNCQMNSGIPAAYPAKSDGDATSNAVAGRCRRLQKNDLLMHDGTMYQTTDMMHRAAGLALLVGTVSAGKCLHGDCYPGNEFCAAPFQDAPAYHLMDQHGCGENDPNGPVFDPVHGVVHHFYQIHLAADPGHGPDYGHFVSKDFVSWAQMPVAIWNGFDSSVWPPTPTPYDNEAIFTGSAIVVDGAGPGGKGKGIVNIYPGLCNKADWKACSTGTLLAQATPADYAGDALLANWTKPSYNPIMENTQRDPSTPWKTPSGEWRMRTYDAKIYGCASDADMLSGKWYEIGVSKDFRQCECPSVYPLPAPTPGTEALYAKMEVSGDLPNTVHKTSCGGDWWQIGTYDAGPPKTLGNFTATPGPFKALFAQRKIDQGQFYASKDNEYPTKDGKTRRINWGWATVPPASTQTLPREITFNAAAMALQQYPIDELKALRGPALFDKSNIAIDAGKPVGLGLGAGAGRQSEFIASFELPSAAAQFAVTVAPPGSKPSSGKFVGPDMPHTDLVGGDYNVTHYPHVSSSNADTCKAACDADSKCKAWTFVIRGAPSGSGDCCLKSGSVPCPDTNPKCTSGARDKGTTVHGCGASEGVTCTIDFAGAASSTVNVSCGKFKDSFVLAPGEKAVEIRMFMDWTFMEVYFQQGRVAMTVNNAMGENTDIEISSAGGAAVTVAQATAYPMKGIWTSPEAVRAQPRVYG